MTAWDVYSPFIGAILTPLGILAAVVYAVNLLQEALSSHGDPE